MQGWSYVKKFPIVERIFSEKIPEMKKRHRLGKPVIHYKFADYRILLLDIAPVGTYADFYQQRHV
jgi:hypothetical protein